MMYGIFTKTREGWYERYDYRNGQTLHFVAAIHEAPIGRTFVFELNGSILKQSKRASKGKPQIEKALLDFTNQAYAEYVNKY
jgi:hypothetical protein